VPVLLAEDTAIEGKTNNRRSLSLFAKWMGLPFS
jgi:hypothetical protein